MNSDIRLGVIGLSPGNGHPYSWSAIFNGYNAVAMEDCGFPVIPRYLEARQFPDDCIAGARVTMVWTQDLRLSRHIAEAAYIDSVAEHYTEMLGNVDAILLARDDVDTRLSLASPFLKAGVPIYVDKPLALTRRDATQLIELQRFPGQLFSCSALRYSKDLRLSDEAMLAIGSIRRVSGATPKDWDRYAVHVIDPILQIVPDRGELVSSRRHCVGDHHTLHVTFASGVDVQVSTMGSAQVPIALTVVGTHGSHTMHLSDTFGAFRAALQDFVDGIRSRDVRTTEQSMLNVVDLIELGRSS